MLVKKGLLSLAFVMPLVSTMAQAGHHAGSLDDLRRSCMQFRSNAQIGRFNIKLLCSGAFTHWEEEQGSFGLPNHSQIHTHTTCKDNRFQTGEGIFDFVIPAYAGNCARYVKKEMRAPEGVGISVNIQHCEDLIPETVEAICKREIHAYCADQFAEVGPGFGGDFSDQSSASSSSSAAFQGGYGQEGVCTLHTVDTIDTCGMY